MEQAGFRVLYDETAILDSCDNECPGRVQSFASMIVAAVTTLCALVGLIFLVQARRRFRRRRFGSCTMHGLSSLVFFWPPHAPPCWASIS